MIPLRRRFLLGAGALLVSPLVGAQAVTKLPTLGILHPGITPLAQRLENSPLRKRLRELGWLEGKTCLIEAVYGEGKSDRMPALANVLVAKKVDVIVALGPEAAVAAAGASTTIPIVFWAVAYPVEQGLVDSLAKPGRNVTGVAFWTGPELDLKRVQFLREIAPDAVRLASIWTPSVARTVAGGAVTKGREAFDAAARELGFEPRSFPVGDDADFDPIFATILKWGAQALEDPGSPLTFRNMKRILNFANRNGLPAIYSFPDFVEAGGLISYGIDWPRTVVRSADLVDKILRGAKPAELPVELPDRFSLALNRKTAKTLGLRIPQSILLRADRLIE